MVNLLVVRKIVSALVGWRVAGLIKTGGNTYTIGSELNDVSDYEE